MIINNRRDAGYTIISRFEEEFRNTLEEVLSKKNADIFVGVPSGVIAKANSRSQKNGWSDFADFLENIDFPDLKEISLYNNNLSQLGTTITKQEFSDILDELYILRCKIAHVKGYFTSIDLDKLIENCSKISSLFIDSNFAQLIEIINRNPESVIVKIPRSFVIDFLESNGVLNNIPIPDYEFEGGFVGRDLDRKKIIQYLNTDKFSVITLTGAGGVGKTSLALRVIQDITQKPGSKPFDAIIWLSAKENKLSALGIEDIEPTLKSYEELLDTIINVVGFYDEEQSDILSKENLVNNIFEISSKILIVVDNLETIIDERIINFIINAPLNVKFLITSRKGLGQVEIRHEVKQLKEKESIYLFRQLAKDKQLDTLLSLKDEVIKSYVEKVSYYPLAIKWVIGQIARGKDINKVVDSIHASESDISKFCFEQIFQSLSVSCKKVLYAICCFDDSPAASVLQYVIQLDDDDFDKSIEELILVSLLIPEQYQNEKNEISRKFTMLSLTKGFVRLQLTKNIDLKEELTRRIIDVESTLTITEKAKREYRYSLYNLGAKTDEEKVAAILAQAAFQKYQSGRYDEAVEDYKKAIRMAPSFYAVYRNWGVMESYEGHLQEAHKLMERAEQLNNKDPQIYLLWGNIHRKNGKLQEALLKYECAHLLDPEDHIVLNAIGTTKSRLGEYEEANALLRRALVTKLSIDSTKHKIINLTSIAENLISWSDLLFRDRKYPECEDKLNQAVNYIKDALSIDNSDSKIYQALSRANIKKGYLYVRINKKTKAIDCFTQVFNKKPRSIQDTISIINAGIELALIHKSFNKIFSAKAVIKQIESDFGSSQVMRQHRFSELQLKFQHIKAELFDENRILGFISKVDLRFGYLIIVNSRNTQETYIANNEDFIPRIEKLDVELEGKEVTFIPLVESRKNGDKKYSAKAIKKSTTNHLN